MPKIGRVKLLGSASNPNVRYITDYDFYSKITKNDLPKIQELLTEQMLNRYFIEVKVEGELKGKFVKRRSFDIKGLTQIFFVKVDFVIYTDYTFRELSIIFDLNPKKEDFKDNLKMDIKDYLTSKDYYKATKRMFSLAKFEKTRYTKKLLDFINETGLLGSTLANLKAIELVMSKFPKNQVVKKQIAINLKSLGIKIKELDKMTERITKRLNEEAKDFLKTL